MPAQKISKRDPEIERGEKSAYNICEVLDRAGATSTWTVITHRGLDYVVSARLELGGKPLGGPPLAEMATKAQQRDAVRWCRSVAQHMARMEAGATFWSFAVATKPAKLTAAYVVHVEAMPAGAGVNGHTGVIAELRHAAARAERAARRPQSRKRRKR